MRDIWIQIEAQGFEPSLAVKVSVQDFVAIPEPSDPEEPNFSCPVDY